MSVPFCPKVPRQVSALLILRNTISHCQNAPQTEQFTGCDIDQQGISVGWIDIYDKGLPGQSVDVTDLPNGIYWLEGEFDPGHRFLESNIENNISKIKVALCHNPLSFPASDSIWMTSDTGTLGTQVTVDINAGNESRLGAIILPLTWAGPLPLHLDSVSNTGTRTEALADPRLVSINPFTQEVTYALNFPDGAAPGLLPGSGPVLKMFFTIPPDAPIGVTNDIALTVINGQGPLFGLACGSFTPTNLLNGTISSVLCCQTAGDANDDGNFNIADVTFGLAYIFQGSLAPSCLDQADANSDGKFNISDVTYGLNAIFSGGPLPICGTSGT